MTAETKSRANACRPPNTADHTNEACEESNHYVQDTPVWKSHHSLLYTLFFKPPIVQPP